MTLRERISDRRAGGCEVTDLATARTICNRMVAYYPSPRYSVTNVAAFNGLSRVVGCKSLCLLRLGAEISVRQRAEFGGDAIRNAEKAT
jgi:hypothetical protein